MKKTILVLSTLCIYAGTVAQKPTPKAPPPPPVVTVDVVEPPPPPVPVSEDDEYEKFMKRNPIVKRIAWSKDDVRIYLKSGKVERYNLAVDAEVKEAARKYGALPAAPPPPPAPVDPPPPPTAVIDVMESLGCVEYSVAPPPPPKVTRKRKA